MPLQVIDSHKRKSPSNGQSPGKVESNQHGTHQTRPEVAQTASGRSMPASRLTRRQYDLSAWARLANPGTTPRIPHALLANESHPTSPLPGQPPPQRFRRNLSRSQSTNIRPSYSLRTQLAHPASMSNLGEIRVGVEPPFISHPIVTLCNCLRRAETKSIVRGDWAWARPPVTGFTTCIKTPTSRMRGPSDDAHRSRDKNSNPNPQNDLRPTRYSKLLHGWSVSSAGFVQHGTQSMLHDR